MQSILKEIKLSNIIVFDGFDDDGYDLINCDNYFNESFLENDGIIIFVINRNH
jgi:hypothetical protein